MSTFNGVVKEFPEIRIDFFRRHPNLKPPSACFLSHIHSDHVQGLESPVLPFVYCSAATRRLLLRMEKYPHRINFAKGILEARKQTYRHLKKVLKALPLQTPTVIELAPKRTIRVTLFDANHCPGAVMFLIEGDSKAILYTGDIRSEAWWVNSLIRHPSIIPYTLGDRTLSCLYLDTTFATKSNHYATFPSKADGLAELISKASQYPPETVFYFRAWTLGYEDAWLALSSALSSRIHVDTYQTRLYSGLLDDHGECISVQEAASLVGFAAGNHWQEGCLTDDPTVAVRIHSCEPGTACHASLSQKRNLVWITPIISRAPDGTEIYEIGAGGGGGDLYQTPELDITDPGVLQALQAQCANAIRDPNLLNKVLSALETASSSGATRISLDCLGINLDSDVGVTLHDFIALLSDSSSKAPNTVSTSTALTTTIHFPYSRHSSYYELLNLTSAFKPQDICPCTVDLETWNEELSMEKLFGEMCSERVFAHDAVNRVFAGERKSRKRKRDVDDDGEETQRSLDEEGGKDGNGDVFESAEEQRGHGQGQPDGDEPPPDITTTAATAENANARPLGHEQAQEHNDPPPRLELELDTPTHRLKAIESAFRALKDKRNNDPDLEPEAEPQLKPLSLSNQTQTPRLRPTVAHADRTTESTDLEAASEGEAAGTNAQTQTSQLSLGLSAFDSQSQALPQSQSQPESSRSPRIQARISAYHAAKASLSGDSHLWDELGIRSTGYAGHVDEEIEL
jgi:DNA cross-link repair 1C protein